MSKSEDSVAWLFGFVRDGKAIIEAEIPMRLTHLSVAIAERDAEIERLRKTMTIVFDLDLARQAVEDLLAELERRGK